MAAGKGVGKAGAAVGNCIGSACKTISNKISGSRTRPADLEMGHHSKVRREAEIEGEDEDSALLARYAEPVVGEDHDEDDLY